MEREDKSRNAADRYERVMAAFETNARTIGNIQIDRRYLETPMNVVVEDER